MLLPTFTYLEPRSIAEASEMLARHRQDGVKILAGGTDILVDLKQRIFSRDQRMQGINWLVSLNRIPGLREIAVEGQTLVIGAMATMTEIAAHPEVRRRLRALAEGAMEVGSPLVRNRGTLAGNIANSRPAADTIGPVIALDGEIIAAGLEGDRRIRAEEFFTGPGRNVLAPDEVIRAISFPLPANRAGSAYVKLGVRKALDISIVGVSAFVALDGEERAADARICLTSVGPTPILSRAASDAVVGRPLGEATLHAAGEAAKGDARPIDDSRGSAWYRREMVYTLTKRMLARAWRGALEEKS